MHVNVKKWGNSAAVRIPASVVATANIKIDQAVDVRAEDGRIVIEPIVASDWPYPLKYSLDELLAQITPDMEEDEYVDWGPPVGKEVW